MKFLLFLLISTVILTFTLADEVPAEKKKSSMADLAPPLPLDPGCRVVGCYRNMLNMSNNCDKGEFLHSFKKCDQKFYREETCCKKKKE